MPDRAPQPEVRLSQNRSACQAALLTPPGRGAVATVLVAGHGALNAVRPFFRTTQGLTADDFPDSRILYGNWCWRSPEGTPGGDSSFRQAEDVVLARHRQDRLELHCHGGCLAAEAILEDLATGGCQRTDGVDSLVQSQPRPLAGQALRQLTQAPTLRTAAILVDQVEGALEGSLEAIANQLRQNHTVVARHELASLHAMASVGLHLVRPWRVALSGPPNVGKSSLMNALVGYQRAIVHAQPGTTRDVVRVEMAVNGWPIELSDTAGVRNPNDDVEREGVRRARQTARDADLVLLVQDASQPGAHNQHSLIDVDSSRQLPVYNKIDLVPSGAQASKRSDCLSTCALSGQGIPELMAVLVDHLVGRPPTAGAAVPFTQHQVALLQQAMDGCDRNHATTALTLVNRLIDGVE